MFNDRNLTPQDINCSFKQQLDIVRIVSKASCVKNNGSLSAFSALTKYASSKENLKYKETVANTCSARAAVQGIQNQLGPRRHTSSNKNSQQPVSQGVLRGLQLPSAPLIGI